jgi:hydroxyacylglutathione hydrolase
MINIKTFAFNPFQENTFVLYDHSKEAIIVDAGCFDVDEQKQLDDFITENELKVVKVVNTHCHIDHIFGIQYCVDKYKVPFAANPNDDYLLANAVEQGLMFGVEIEAPPSVNQPIKEGEALTFGESSLQIFHVPGHSKGSVAIYSKTDNFVLVGDVLFNGSIGRTDLPGGDYDTLMNSIKNKLFTLPPETTVYSGHGPTTTIGQEIKSNPFFN